MEGLTIWEGRIPNKLRRHNMERKKDLVDSAMVVLVPYMVIDKHRY
jgi:hypothetical protein